MTTCGPSPIFMPLYALTATASMNWFLLIPVTG